MIIIFCLDMAPRQASIVILGLINYSVLLGLVDASSSH